MVEITVAMWYGAVAGAMFGFCIGRYSEELRDLGLFEKFILVLAIAFWPITLVLLKLIDLFEDDNVP